MAYYVTGHQLAALAAANRYRKIQAQIRRDEKLRTLAAASKCRICGGGMLVTAKREIRCSLCDARRAK